MASLSKSNKTNCYTIQFLDQNSVRRSIRIGKMSRRNAQTIKRHVESLLHCKLSGLAPEAETSRWLASIDSKLKARLVNHELIEGSFSSTLGEFISSYTEQRRSDPDIKESTIKAELATCKNLCSHFGNTKSLRTINKKDTERWRIEIAQTRAPNTVRKWVAIAKNTLMRPKRMG